MSETLGNPLYSDIGGYEVGGWRSMPEIVQNSTEVKGFFGAYRWLSNFGNATVFLDGVEYESVEKAYQAAKWPINDRDFFAGSIRNEDAIRYNRGHTPTLYTPEVWDEKKLDIMRFCLEQKFDIDLNPENTKRLVATGYRYLEETNWWNDTFWGKNLAGEGENNLGKLLMDIRGRL